MRNLLRRKNVLIIASSFILILTFVLYFSNRLIAPVDQRAAVVTSEELRDAGLFDVTAPQFGADKTGEEDSTDAIQEAMDAAYNNRGMTYFPPGTYRISRTLIGLRDRAKKDLQAYQLIGSTDGGELPTIVLTQGSFNDDNNANDSQMEYNGNKKAMIHIWGCRGAGEREEGERGCDPDYETQLGEVNKEDVGAGTGYNGYIMNLRFVIEPNNPDAIGVRITGSQGNHVSNIKIEANGAFAGYYGTVGTNSFVENLTVTGGKYGVYNGTGLWGSYSNVTLRNQELLAFTSPKGPPVSLNGFYIVKQTAPAIGEVPGVGYNSTNTDQVGAFSLNDGIIEFTNNNPNESSISTPQDKQISVANVYVKNSGKLIQAGTTSYAGNANGWSKVNVFSNTIPESGYKLVEGVETKGEDYVAPNTFVTTNVIPPTSQSLRMNHGVVRSRIESPDKLMRLAKESGSGVVNVVREGITPVNNVSGTSPDYASQINALINRPGVHTVFFPKGNYPIKGTITLKANTKIIGLNPGLTKITTHPDWRPGPITDMINTVNDANGQTVIALIDIEADRSEGNDKFNNIHWRVGKESVIYQVARGGKGGNTGCKDVPDVGWGTNTYWLWYTDNGGGRVWNGNAASSNCSRWSSRQRAIFVDGTTEPLILYSLNPEDGHGEVEDDREGYMVEIRNAKNVSIRSDKSENDNAVLVRNSENIFILNLGGSVETALRDNTNILVMNTVAKFHTFGNDEVRRPKDLIEEEIDDTLIKKYDTTSTVSVVKRGNIDFSVWDYGAEYEEDPPSSPTPGTPSPTPTTGVTSTPTPIGTPGVTNTPTPIRTPGVTNTPTPIRTPGVTNTPTPIRTPGVTNTPTTRPTDIAGSICGKSDVDGDGDFDIEDFVEYAEAYQDGNRTCSDTEEYRPCGGRDVDRNGKLDIVDFGGEDGFASRYFPKTSCALSE